MLYGHPRLLGQLLVALILAGGPRSARADAKFTYDAAGNLTGIYNLSVDPNNCGSIGHRCSADGGQACCIAGQCGHRKGSACFVTQAISVSVAPDTASVDVGEGRQFTATVQGATDTSVTWLVNGWIGGSWEVGTIDSSGFYVAPAVIPTPATVSVTALSNADQLSSDGASVTITNPASMTVSPDPVSVPVNYTQLFVAMMQNQPVAPVYWSVNGIPGGDPTVGFIDENGLYYAPSTPPFPATIAVAAESVLNSAWQATASVTILPDTSLSIAISPYEVTLRPGKQQQFTIALWNASTNAVTWSVNGIAGGNADVGTVSPTGLYTAPLDPLAPPQVEVTAVLADDPTQWVSAFVNIEGSADVPEIPLFTVTVTPGSTSLNTDDSVQLTAEVGNATDTSVTWAVNGIIGGDYVVGFITDTGFYTAPSTVPIPAVMTVTAASNADPDSSGSASVTIASLAVNVFLSPASTTVQVGLPVQFTVGVSGTVNPAVTWAVNGVVGGSPTVGTISVSGLYAAPSTVPSPSTVTISAVSVADPSRSASAPVIVVARPAQSITVSPRAAVMALGSNLRFAATVRNAANKSVEWRVNGVVGGTADTGTIDISGLYTAPFAMPGSVVTVTAVSKADSTKTANATLTFIAPPGVSVTVAPKSVFLAPQTTATLTATVSGSSDTTVTWLANGVPNGNAAFGTLSPNGNRAIYTAPRVAPASNPITIAAVSNADPTKMGVVSAEIYTPPPVSIGVAPLKPTVAAGQTIHFVAALQAPPYLANTVGWSVNNIVGGNATYGTITKAGVYTAPPVPPSGTISVTVTLDTDPSVRASTTVTVIPAPKVSIAPNARSLTVSQTFTFVATVINLPSSDLSWSVNGIQGGNASVGTITGSSTYGKYVAPSTVPDPPTVTVTATSAADPSQSASAQVTIYATPIVTIYITPGGPTFAYTGLIKGFTATVGNTTDTSVTWSVNGIIGGNQTIGTISSTGSYTAPSVPPDPPNVTISATANVDPARSASVLVTILPAPPPAVYVSAVIGTTIVYPPPCYELSVPVGQMVIFGADVVSTTSGISWRVNAVVGGDDTFGKIDATGVYHAPSTIPTDSIVSVSAVLKEDPRVWYPVHVKIVGY